MRVNLSDYFWDQSSRMNRLISPANLWMVMHSGQNDDINGNKMPDEGREKQGYQKFEFLIRALETLR